MYKPGRPLDLSHLTWKSPADLPKGVPLFSLRQLEDEFHGRTCDKSNQLVDQFMATIHRSGFFYLKDHGVDEGLIRDLIRVSQSFFAEPESLKRHMMVEELPLRGYSAFEEESTARSIGQGTYPDRCQKYTWTFDNVAPTVEFRQIWDLYQNEQKRIAQSLLHIIGMTLGLNNNDIWEGIIDGQPMVRHLYYPEIEDDGLSSLESMKRMAPHSDIGSITLLYQTPCANGLSGLEALIDGRYQGLPAVEGTFVVNLGETLTHITNGFIKSTMHRVVASACPGNARTATATFFLPHADLDLTQFHGSAFQGHYLQDDMQRFQELVDEIAVTFCGKKTPSPRTQI